MSFGFGVLGFGFWILGFGFWETFLRRKERKPFRFWILATRLTTARVSPPQRGLPATRGLHHSGVSPPERPEMVKFVLLLCCRPRKKRKRAFLAHLTFWTLLPTSGVSPPQRGLPTRAARNGQICPECLLLCYRPRKNRFLKGNRFWPICPFGPLGSPPGSPTTAGFRV